ncbi:MAG TPA: MBL fold metallo-hydrolase, partial [Methyloradius sp.]
YRIGNMAYLTDVSEIPESSLALLNNLDVLLLDCLRYTTHFTHIHLEQSLTYASQIAAKQTYLIHMTHDIEYETLSSQLPANVHLGFDGLRLEF